MAPPQLSNKDDRATVRCFTLAGAQCGILMVDAGQRASLVDCSLLLSAAAETPSQCNLSWI